ncbi:MAG: hypothetical protein H6622_15165 [Halobacteriovoraceae bacterium]|nr:hypothetical protein [Halobacteriovoraceae bacterium]
MKVSVFLLLFSLINAPVFSSTDLTSYLCEIIYSGTKDSMGRSIDFELYKKVASSIGEIKDYSEDFLDPEFQELIRDVDYTILQKIFGKNVDTLLQIVKFKTFMLKFNQDIYEGLDILEVHNFIDLDGLYRFYLSRDFYFSNGILIKKVDFRETNN